MKCEECFGRIDEQTGYCTNCGLELLDNPCHIYRGLKGLSSDGRANNASLVKNKYDRRGFVCIRCLALFGERNGRIIELEEKISGREYPGTNLAHFATRVELKQHMRFHRGSRQLPDRALRSLSDNRNPYKSKPRQKPIEEGEKK